MDSYDITRARIDEMHRIAARIRMAERARIDESGLVEKYRVSLRWRIGYSLVRLGKAIAGSAAVIN